MKTNLPPQIETDSAASTKLYFGTYGEVPLSFNATDVSVAVNYFEKRGFDKTAAQVTAMSLLRQAKIEGVSISSVLDQLKGYNDLEVSGIVAQILNNSRTPTSTLGYKQQIQDLSKSRNIYP
jgi:FlaG/FlaF family flagellin (archaellin)